MPILPSASLPKNPSPQVQLAIKFAEGMSTANFDLLSEILAEDHHYYVLPESLGLPPITTKEAFIAHYKVVLPIFTKFDVPVYEVIEAPGKVVIHASSNAETKIGVPYTNEYILIFQTVQQPDGSYKLKETKEFVDSKFTAGFREALQKAIGGAPSS